MFKFNKFGLALGTNLKFYTTVTKELKVKVSKFLELVPTFVEVTREKLVGGPRVTSTFFYRTPPVVSSDTSYPILTAILLYGNFCQSCIRDVLLD